MMPEPGTEPASEPRSEPQAERGQATPSAEAASTAPAAPSPSLDALVWNELREIYDPEIPVNVVDLGLIYAMETAPLPDGGHRVEVLMTVTSPACGMSEVLRSEADARLRKLPDVREVEVAVTFEPPWTPELMSEDARLLLNL